MRDDLRERRERTWELLVVMGIEYSKAVSRVASEYDCAEGTVKSDISRMENWVGELDVNYYTGVSRLRELRQNRQRKWQMAMQAQQDEDLGLERKIRKDIDDNIVKDIRMSQRLGLTNEEPTEIDIGGELSEEDKDVLDEVCGVEGEAVDLEDMA